MPKRGDKQQQESGPRARARKAVPATEAASTGGAPRQVDAVSDGLVLAAVERAYRHSRAEGLDAPIWHILDHLAITRRTKAAREVRARLDALDANGLVLCSRRHGVVVWGLTSTGKRRLKRQLRSADAPRLPESPQHRAWRTAKDLAGQEIERLRDDLRGVVIDALDLAAADPPANSDAWFVLAERLQHATRVLGSATYCLHEWREPSDEQADVDTLEQSGEQKLPQEERRSRHTRRAGRRNTTLWREEPQ